MNVSPQKWPQIEVYRQLSECLRTTALTKWAGGLDRSPRAAGEALPSKVVGF